MPVFPQSELDQTCTATGYVDVDDAKRRVRAARFSAHMWFHRNAPASSAARGRRHDHICIVTGFVDVYGAKRRVRAFIFCACMWFHRNAPASSAARGRRHDHICIVTAFVDVCGAKRRVRAFIFCAGMWFTGTLRRAAQREGVGKTACRGLGGYIPLSRGVHLP